MEFYQYFGDLAWGNYRIHVKDLTIKDRQIIGRLLQTIPLDELKALALHFCQHGNDEPLDSTEWAARWEVPYLARVMPLVQRSLSWWRENVDDGPL